jgi:hypothetical protein
MLACTHDSRMVLQVMMVRLETWAWGGVSKHVGWQPLALLHRKHAVVSAPQHLLQVLVPCASPLLSHHTHKGASGIVHEEQAAPMFP